MVEDTERALLDAARNHRESFDLPVIGVTGSWGKTTTKELIASVLSRSGTVHKSPGNYNTEYGLPLALLQMDESSDYGVFELGLQFPGDVGGLSEVLSPTLGLITGVGMVHAENFRGVEEIAKEKLKITKGMAPESRVIINGDSPPLRKEAEKLEGYHFVRYGLTEAGCHYRATEVAPNRAEGVKFTLIDGPRSAEASLPGSPLTLESGLRSRANVYNLLAAVSVGLELGVSPSALREGVNIPPLPHRLEPKDFFGGTVVDDTYNANPAATRNALEYVGNRSVGGRKIFVFGDMQELGENSPRYHRELASDVRDAGINALLAVGKLTGHLVEALKENQAGGPAAEWFPTRSALTRRLENSIKGEDNLVLIKGSRGMRMEEIVDFLVHGTRE